MHTMPRLRFYLLFATGSAVVFTALSALLLALRFSIADITLTVPMLSAWVVTAIFYPHYDFRDAPDSVHAVFIWGLFFIQWFPIGLVIAYFFRLYRLRCCK
jgi:hypothetical protein